jgi:hypothetical protein
MRRPGGKFALDWHGHCYLAELLAQAQRMLADVGGIVRKAYGARDKESRQLEQLSRTDGTLHGMRLRCQDLMYAM